MRSVGPAKALWNNFRRRKFAKIGGSCYEYMYADAYTRTLDTCCILLFTIFFLFSAFLRSAGINRSKPFADATKHCSACLRKL